MFVQGVQKSYATGLLAANSSTLGDDVSLILLIDDRTTASSEVRRLYSNSELAWHLHDSGDIALNSQVTWTDDLWNTQASVAYGQNKYRYFATEQLTSFLCSGRGGYGGDLLSW